MTTPGSHGQKKTSKKVSYFGRFQTTRDKREPEKGFLILNNSRRPRTKENLRKGSYFGQFQTAKDKKGPEKGFLFRKIPDGQGQKRVSKRVFLF